MFDLNEKKKFKKKVRLENWFENHFKDKREQNHMKREEMKKYLQANSHKSKLKMED